MNAVVEATPILNLSLIGPFAAECGGTRLELTARKSRALLAALALSPGMAISRARATDLLWGSRGEAQARASLRQELAGLRRALGPAAEALQADNERIWLAAGKVATDAGPVMAGDPSTDLMCRAARAELLSDMDIREEGFEDWLRDIRAGWTARLGELLRARIAAAEASTDRPAVEWAAAELMRLEPHDGPALRALMRACAARGARAAALEACDAAGARLKADLGLAPDPETLALRAAIAEGRAESAPPEVGSADPANTGAVHRRPAVLFLPFEALSRSDEDRLLALGLCEDIRTTLACWRWFPVIGPEAVKGREGDLGALAEALQAGYVVTGSVRRAGDRARVTARLIDAASGRELWSHAFDGQLADVFDFQEEISQRIVSQIEPEITRAAAARIRVKRPADMTAWDLMAQAREEERKGGDGYGTPEANAAQRALAEAAIARDPDFSDAWALLARCCFRDFLLRWTADPTEALAEGLAASARAVEINPANSTAQAYRAQFVLFGQGDAAGGVEHAQNAVRLNPSNVMGHVMMGCALVFTGDPDRAFDHYEKACRLNPNYSNFGAVICDQMMCRALQGRMEEAVALARRTMTTAPGYYRGLQRCAAVLAHAGEIDEARALMARTEEIGGAFSERYVRETYPFTRAKDLDFLIEGLYKAGWVG